VEAILSDRAFDFVQALIFVLFMGVGLLALVFPEDKYRSTVGRWWAIDKRTTGKGLQRRIAGLVFLTFGTFALVSQLSSTYSRKGAQGQATPVNPLPIGYSWLPFVLGVLAVTGGSFVALNPEVLVRWSQRRLFPEQELSEQTIRTWRFALRAMGILMIYGSGELFKAWARPWQ
jgi:hypothetical protein